jgi:hypothetical protein
VNGEAARTPGGIVRPAYREVTIPATLPLVLTSSVASDRSAVEDALTAELTNPISIEGRDVLPAGTRLSGVVSDVNGSGRVKGTGDDPEREPYFLPLSGQHVDAACAQDR